MLPLFEGDDLRRLAREITMATRFLRQAQAVRYALGPPPATWLQPYGRVRAASPRLLPLFSSGPGNLSLGPSPPFLSTRARLQKKTNTEPKGTAL